MAAPRDPLEARARLEELRRSLPPPAPRAAATPAAPRVDRPPKRRHRWKRFVLLGACAAALVQLAPEIVAGMLHTRMTAALFASDPPSRLPVPVIGVARSRLRDTWGAARSGGRRHQGIDIFANRGRPVISTTRGIVTTVGQNELGGNIVGVLGPGRQWHYYAHLERFASVRPGDVVQSGEVLGYVGTSGNAAGTPPHLHYGIYRAGRRGPVNPYPFLSGRGSEEASAVTGSP